MIRQSLCCTFPEATVDCSGEVQMLDGLDQISVRAQRNRFADLFRIVHSRAHDHVRLWPELLQSSQRFQSVHAGHLQVEHYHLRNASMGHSLQCFVAAAGGLDLVGIELQQGTKIPADFWRVIHYQDGGFNRITCSISHRGIQTTGRLISPADCRGSYTFSSEPETQRQNLGLLLREATPNKVPHC